MLGWMMNRILGTVCFSVRGDAVRFFNAAAKSGVELWGYTVRNGRAAAYCTPRTYLQLRPIAKRSGVVLRCQKKQGLPFLLNRLKKRPGLIAGAVFGCAVFWVLSGFVWGVQVSGAETLSETAVLQAARNNGVFVGVRRSQLSGRLSAHGIMSDLSAVSWVAVNTDGCFVEIALKEGEQTPQVADDDVLTNIVAERAGAIVAIEAERGRPEVVLGQAVQAGDLLISGSYQAEADPWSSSPNPPFEHLGAARGRVLAETYREFAVQVSASKKEQQPTGITRTQYTLSLFGLRLPLGLHAEPTGTWQKITQKKQLAILGVSLPIACEVTTYRRTEEVTRVLSEEDQKRVALLKLRQMQCSVLPMGGVVKSEQLTYAAGDGVCVLYAQCRCIEEIGRVEPVLAEATEISQ